MSHEYDLVWEPQDTTPPSGHCGSSNSEGAGGTGGFSGSSGAPDDGIGGGVNSGGGVGNSCIDCDSGHGHSFVKKTFHRPTYCHHCSEMLWGLLSQGYICSLCSFTVHDRCLKSVLSPCTCVAPNLVLRPVSHCWSDPAHFKRKFCNVCRKRLEDFPAVRCESEGCLYMHT